MIEKLKFNKVADIFPLLSGDDLDELTKDIDKNGQREPICLHPDDDSIIDGRNRYLACQALGREVEYVYWDCCGSLVSYVVSLNLRRRHLDSSQRAAVALDMLPFLETEAKDRQKAGQKSGGRGKKKTIGKELPIVSHDDNKAVAQAAKITGTNRQYVSDVKRIASEEPELVQEIREGKITVPQAKLKVKAKMQEDRRAKQVELGRSAEADGFHVGDFREVAKGIPDNSVSLIFTDPQYDKKSIPLYGDLAKLAAEKLIEGGSMITYIGQYKLDKILSLTTPHLRLWWTLAVIHTGQSARMREYGIVVGWKPLLWFVKGTRDVKKTFVNDFVYSKKEKGCHPWQQSVVEAEYYIEKLTEKNELVWDPFCGGGTTAAACQSLGRKFITSDIDEKAIIIAKGRIAGVFSNADGAA